MASPSLRSIAVTALFVLIPALVGAQNPSPAISVIGGISQYDLSGTGDTEFGAVRLLYPLGRVLAVEPGLTVMGDSTQADTRNLRLLPEVQLQAQLPGTVFRPYVGVGAGLSWANRDEPLENQTDATLSVAGGVRIAVARGWLLTGELRVRAIDPWVGTTADWGLGIGREL